MITIYIDGGARGNPGPAGYGLVAKSENSDVLEEGYGYIGEQTCNFAEYCALLAALELALKKRWDHLQVKSDSQLLVRQIKGEYKVKNERLQAFHRRALQQISRFKSFKIEHIDRNLNKQADKLAGEAIKKLESQPKGINPILIKGG